MSIAEDIGTALSSMGPGLLSGIGKAMSSQKELDHDPAHDHDGSAPDPNKSGTASPNAFKNGGLVKKTGIALVHKGEMVVPKHKVEEVKLSHHRAVMHLHKGGLHRALHVPEDENIPAAKLQAARNSKNPHVRKMAELANTMEHKWG